jgi:hypothetical protein
MPLSRRNLTLLAAFAVLAVVLAACGGGGSSAAKANYASALNRFCTSFKGGVAKVQAATSRIPRHATRQQALGTFASAIDAYAKAIRQGVQQLDEATPPSDYKSFNDGTVKGFTAAAGRLEQDAAKARDGNVQVLSNVGQDLEGIDVPDTPKDLQQAANACS